MNWSEKILLLENMGLVAAGLAVGISSRMRAVRERDERREEIRKVRERPSGAKAPPVIGRAVSQPLTGDDRVIVGGVPTATHAARNFAERRLRLGRLTITLRWL